MATASSANPRHTIGAHAAGRAAIGRDAHRAAFNIALRANMLASKKGASSMTTSGVLLIVLALREQVCAHTKSLDTRPCTHIADL